MRSNMTSTNARASDPSDKLGEHRTATTSPATSVAGRWVVIDPASPPRPARASPVSLSVIGTKAPPPLTDGPQPTRVKPPELSSTSMSKTVAVTMVSPASWAVTVWLARVVTTPSGMTALANVSDVGPAVWLQLTGVSLVAEQAPPAAVSITRSVPPVAQFQPQVSDWDIVELDGIKRLRRVFSFDDFAKALKFTNKVGELAEEEGHHPALMTEWGRTTVTWWTHKIRGLHRNDFVMAAKTDVLYQR